MHCTVWTYAVTDNFTGDIAELVAASAPDYLDVPGLIRKYFGAGEDDRAVAGIYLWETKAAADAFFSPAWLRTVTARWKTAPERADWSVLALVDALLPAVTTYPATTTTNP
jgi:hypothetical protein